MEDAESRFAHLLQPIRDLTKNWEVDVAAQLGEYLEELDQICISFDNGKTTMNFIEAALLIQGSACVYSKKVEYLYSLVFQALDFISGKKRDRNKQLPSLQEDGTDPDGHSASCPEDEEEFLSLDDLPESRANVNLRNDHSSNVVPVVPLVPMSLVPPNEEEKKNSPLYSRQGEVLASRKDFWMNTSLPHASGAFMLEPATGPAPEEYLPPASQAGHTGAGTWGPGAFGGRQSGPSSRAATEESLDCGGGGEVGRGPRTGPFPLLPDHGGAPGGIPCRPGGWVRFVGRSPLFPSAPPDLPATKGQEAEKEMPDISGCGTPVPVLNFSREERAVEAVGGSEDEDGEVGGLPDEDLSVGDPGPGGPLKSPREHRNWQKGASEQQQGRLRNRVAISDPEVQRKEAMDPWQSLDPFDSPEDKPFKKGKPYSVPHHVAESPGNKRKRRGPSKLQDFHQWYMTTYMEVLYWQHVKERLEVLRKLQRRGGEGSGKKQLAEQWLQQTQAEMCPPEEDRAEDFLEQPEADDGLEPEDILTEEPELLADQALEPGMVVESLTYEDLVRRNVDLFIANSHKYVQETELSQRIQAWDDKIRPLLQEQERHGPFDIHDYGDRVVSGFGQLNTWYPFARLAAGKPPFEVCRLLLASLQLANDHTVEITQQAGLQEGVDTMALRLLSRQRAHERFQTYVAPSMALR
uniref:Condensin-2 complex subunit H2 n=1 Tax=Ornithorhynchus anatinus TaxID=9258 RepID=A0A6I8NB78_ORNAN